MKKLSATLLLMALAACVRADEVGEVSTAFILIGANHKVVVEAYDDPKVHGVTSYSDKLIDGSPQNSVTAVPLGQVVLP